jgi:hypothetical protein
MFRGLFGAFDTDKVVAISTILINMLLVDEQRKIETAILAKFSQ